MYSPAIAPGLIPVLYRLGKARSVPMTTLVSELLFDALERGGKGSVRTLMQTGDAWAAGERGERGRSAH